jgi:hypothetical protein
VPAEERRGLAAGLVALVYGLESLQDSEPAKKSFEMPPRGSWHDGELRTCSGKRHWSIQHRGLSMRLDRSRTWRAYRCSIARSKTILPEGRRSEHFASWAPGPGRPSFLSATPPLPGDGEDRPSSLRRRVSALRVLVEIGVVRRDWAQLRNLLEDPSPDVVCAAAHLAFDVLPHGDQVAAGRAILRVLPGAAWDRRMNAPNRLARCFPEVAEAVGKQLRVRLASKAAAPDSIAGVLQGKKPRRSLGGVATQQNGGRSFMMFSGILLYSRR